MRLYDSVIEEMLSLLPQTPDRSAPYSEEMCAADGDKNALLFGSDTAYELGGSGKVSVESVLFEGAENDRDEVLVFGRDLCEIRADSPFAHLTIVRLRQQAEEELSYEQLKEIGFSVFQLYPKGYHIRISPSSCREQVRVAKTSLSGAEPLSFFNVGCSLIRLLKKNENVESARVIFVTDPEVNYAALAALARKAKQITEAVKHTMVPDTLDCGSCKMKPICDEVEGLRELHFQKEGKRKQNAT